MQKHCYLKFVIIKKLVDAIVSVDCTYVIVVCNFLFHFEVNDFCYINFRDIYIIWHPWLVAYHWLSYVILIDILTKIACYILQIMLVICNVTEFCEMYTEYSCYRKCHVNLYALQMCGKFLSSLYSKTL